MTADTTKPVIEGSQDELDNLRILQTELLQGPPANWSSKGAWCPRCRAHGQRFRSHKALMEHFGKQHLHATLCRELCPDDWSDDDEYDHWDGNANDFYDGSEEDEDYISLPVPAGTLVDGA